ncbi:MAG: MgtC/SapB family protein [Proteobacteria bacterium]|nr:MAG: MgtC/SapB family protein [Pseudomonadota bacterium]
MNSLHPADWSYLQLFQFFAPKVILTVICGGLIGLERELKSKPAGIKTNILICMGSALYTAVSVLISTSLADRGHFGDPARISAQIVSGIGFLGGGAIVQAKGTIHGLTTAATIWVVAALGITIGLGYHDVAVALSIMTILILVGVSYFEDRVLGRSLSFQMEIVLLDESGSARKEIHRLLGQNDLVLESFELSTRGSEQIVQMKYTGHRSDQRKFSLSLWSTPGVREIRNV